MKCPCPRPEKKGSVAPSGASLVCICAFLGGGPDVLRTVLGGLWMPVGLQSPWYWSVWEE